MNAESSARRVLSRCAVARVEQSAGGLLYLTLGGLTVPVGVGVCRALWRTLGAALEQIDALGPGEGARPSRG